MKYSIFFFLLIILLVLFKIKNNSSSLKTGDIAFIGFNSAKNDGFKLLTFVDIPPKTTIYFTDSEWNGNHFGADESDIIWKTGEDIIGKGSKIHFKNIGSIPKVTHGTVKGTLRISKNGDAIFGHLGSPRMPTSFLCAIANNKLSYGTLLNTGLIEGLSAMTFPKETISAVYIGPHYPNSNKQRTAILNLSNYNLNRNCFNPKKSQFVVQ